MKLVAACLTVLVTVMTATLVPQTAAASRPEPNANIDIVVDGTAVPVYAHGGRLYVEARRGREYEIRLRNPFPVRVAVALSVDGLNTIDARHTTATDARKWVIEPYGTITIRGWQTSQVEARRFEFTTESASYGHALGQTANLGVISAVFFRERVPPPDVNILTPLEPRRGMAAPSASAPQAESEAAPSGGAEMNSADKARRQRDESAATGMGRATDHFVRTVHLDLEHTPAQSIDIRYEFREQLVRLGIRPDRERDHRRYPRNPRGFADEFSPIPPTR